MDLEEPAFTQSMVSFHFPSDKSDEQRCVDIPVPLPEYVEIDEYVAKAGAAGAFDYLLEEDVRSQIKSLVFEELDRLQSERDDALIEAALESGSNFQDLQFKTLSASSSKSGESFGSTFADQFSYIMHNSSSDHLMLLMRLELQMEKEMSRLIRARSWEVDQLTKECEAVLGQSTNNDMHPHQLSKLNEKLRQVHGSYSCQIEALVEEQRKNYRSMVEAIYSCKGSILKVPENLKLDSEDEFPVGSMGSAVSDQDSASQSMTEVDESFTICIGAQLKSMHNVRILTTPSLVRLCAPEVTGDISSRLQMGMSLYGRSLTGMVMLVSKDPFEHTKSRSAFSRVCEQSTDLHFGSLARQLEEVADSAREANSWRADCSATDSIDSSSINEGNEGRKVSRNDCTLSVGDVYCTKHSNLRQVQIAFHLVSDELLETSDISSRHPCLNGIRNVIRLMARLGVTTIFIPLLLIEKANESTTIAWCIRRAEMVYKCVKGYLMEICGSACGGSASAAPHYNVNFVLPSGLSDCIYQQITAMLPTIYHLVPGVSAQVEVGN